MRRLPRCELSSHHFKPPEGARARYRRSQKSAGNDEKGAKRREQKSRGSCQGERRRAGQGASGGGQESRGKKAGGKAGFAEQQKTFPAPGGKILLGAYSSSPMAFPSSKKRVKSNVGALRRSTSVSPSLSRTSLYATETPRRRLRTPTANVP